MLLDFRGATGELALPANGGSAPSADRQNR